MIEGYRSLLRGGGRLQETPPWGACSELELQARFYRGEYGTEWTGTDGERIEMINPGQWNHEPGPDFRGARLRIDGRELRGDIEIDVKAGDWEGHGHAENRAFSDVALHGFFETGARRFYTRDCDHRLVPQVLLAAETVRQKSTMVGGDPLEASDALRLVEAAAAYRLQQKRASFAAAARLGGEDEALFQALASGLGYKNNKTPFLLVAQRVGLRLARTEEGEARLFGLGGFLQAEYFDSGDEAVREYLSGLWETWWRVRGASARLVLPGKAWNFAALRPQNHPHRRLGALAAMVAEFPRILCSLERAEVKTFQSLLESLKHPYWDRRWNLSNADLAKPMTLVGHDRVLDLTINAFVPALPTFEASWAVWSSLAGPSPSGKVRRALEWLAGGRSAGLGGSALHQQGLVQIYDDFFPEAPASLLKGYASASTNGNVSSIVNP